MLWLMAACLSVLALTAYALAQDAPAPLPPLEQCQAESLQLRAALVTWQQRAVAAEAQLAQQSLAEQRRTFEATLRGTLKPPTDAVFDWDTLTFRRPK